MQELMEEQETVARALTILLQHPAVAFSQRNICRLLQVCKGWRSALQQSEACSVDVVLEFPVPDNQKPLIDSAKAIASFAECLPAHAGLVRSITTCRPTPFVCQETETPRYLANSLLSLGIRAAATKVKQCQQTVQPSLGQCTTSPAPDALVMPGLQLQSYSSHVLSSPNVLSALPASTLTRLQLAYIEGEPWQCNQALARLSNLKSLELGSRGMIRVGSMGTELPPTYYSIIIMLSCLTQLSLPRMKVSSLEVLPKQLQQLRARVYGLDRSQEGCPGSMESLDNLLDLSRLTKLRKLDLSVYSRLAAESRLPDQLQQLSISSRCASAIEWLKLSTLQQLQQLKVAWSMDTSADLMALAGLSQLHDLELQYYREGGSSFRDVMEAAQAWHKSPHLRGLHLQLLCSGDEWAVVSQTVRGLSRLERLSIDQTFGWLFVDKRSRSLCQDIKHLTNLKNFGLHIKTIDMLARDDLLHLTALTGLTKLQLQSEGRDLGISLVTALTGHLTMLKDLTLHGVDSSCCMDALSATARMQGLTRFALFDSSYYSEYSQDVQQYGLHVLTGLHKLKMLQGFSRCSKEVMEGF